MKIFCSVPCRKAVFLISNKSCLASCGYILLPKQCVVSWTLGISHYLASPCHICFCSLEKEPTMCLENGCPWAI